MAKMKKHLYIGLIFGLAWILIKYFAFLFGIFTFGSVRPYVLINMFLLTSAIAVGLFLYKRQQTEESNLLLDIKQAMSIAMVYSVFVSIFLYFFYAKIHPAYNQYQIQQAKELVVKPENLEKIRKSNSEMENKSDQEIIKMSERQTKQIANANFTLVISLLGLTMYSILNSLIISLIYRTVLFKRK